MKYLVSILLLCAAMHAETFAEAAAAAPQPNAPCQPAFWRIENKIDLGLLGGLLAADAFTTQRGLSQGMREANPVMRPFVTRGTAGQAAGSALGYGVAIGTAYVLHRTHHYKAERITMRLMVTVESGVVANNIVGIR